MGVTKTDIYTLKQNELALLLKVIGHPARIAILEYLMEMNTCVCGNLVDEIGLAQATISQHLKELKRVELIQGTIEGTSVCYCINQKKWLEAKDILLQFFETYQNCQDNDCC